ncbi:hypothetical protein NMG60_11031967 [Bertholletia excelsa]
MGRAPCCEKMGLKKGPWSAEEDQILVSYIQRNGHGNWRALPKQAGLLRCGKSCRLRWINYLRPDIKRGNFSKEEEEAIINLHETLGNRWSAIAARLPGRTDNEIKNVWHTHLKKRLKNHHQPANLPQPLTFPNSDYPASSTENSSFLTNPGIGNPGYPPINSPQNSSSELSSVTDPTGFRNNTVVKDEQIESMEMFPQIDASFWNEEFLAETPNAQSGSGSVDIDDSMDFWYNLLIKVDGLPELPDF